MKISQEVIDAAQASHAKFYPRGPFVSVTLAQWAVESGWGRFISGENNYFGIKANAEQMAAGKFTSRWTKEQLPSGQIYSVVQDFANYDSLVEGIDAHAALLCSPHYLACQQAPTPEAYCEALQRCGYATAHNYSATLISVIAANNLKQYDQGAPK